MANHDNIALYQPLTERGGGQGGIALIYPCQWFSSGEPPETGNGFPPHPGPVGEPKSARWRKAILAPGLTKRARQRPMADRNSRAFVPLQERKERREERERRERSAAAARETFVTPAMALGEDRLPYPVERLSSELGWVYFIQASCGSIKIGRAANVRYRLAELQCANPRKLTLIAVALDGSREREYHRRFAAHRLHGEWFEPHPDILAEIERLTHKRPEHDRA